MRRIKHAKKTLLIAVEGDDEQLFLEHLKKFYKNNNYAIKIRNVYGGSPLARLEKIYRFKAQRQYNQVYYLCDTDRDWNEKLFALAEEYKIKLIGVSEICLEGLCR